MKKILISISLILTTTVPLLGNEKEATLKQIQNAESAMIELEKKNDLRNYIPYDIYNDAVVNTITARSLLKDDKLNNAFYYATLSLIKLQSAEIHAKITKYEQMILKLERDYYKTAGISIKSTGNETAIINANLFRKDNAFRRELLDRDIFSKSGKSLSKFGKDSLTSIARVLKAYPSASISIIGHTAYTDPRKNSLRKARFISGYLKKRGIDNSRIKVAGLGNKVVMKTPVGFRRINRVEIIISGIQF